MEIAYKYNHVGCLFIWGEQQCSVIWSFFYYNDHWLWDVVCSLWCGMYIVSV